MRTKVLAFVFLSSILILSACSGKDVSATDVAVAVALTQTAAVPVEAPAEAQPTAETVDQPPAAEAVRIELAPGQTSWYTNGDLNAGSAQYVLAGQAGQQVTFWLTPDPLLEFAALDIHSADGNRYSASPEIYWSNVLPSTQDYFIDIVSLSNKGGTYQLVMEVSPTTIDPALGAMYEPIPDTLCQDLGAAASEALNVDFSIETRAPFFETIGGEAGQGCRLRTAGNGTMFSNPWDVVDTLSNSVGLGWNRIPTYAADGPTGTMIALSRDMGLMLITAGWQPDMGAECPTDQPITACNLAPEQMIYTIKVNIAQYKADFSLDGQWVDPVTGFTLNLYQDWKSIYGNHVMVAQDGNKIDSLDVSINGMLNGQTATVQFQSSFSTDQGTARITYLDVNTIQWKIIDPPDGEFYLPFEATLNR